MMIDQRARHNYTHSSNLSSTIILTIILCPSSLLDGRRPGLPEPIMRNILDCAMQLVAQHVADSLGKSTQLPPADLLRLLVRSRLAGFEDENEA